MLQDFIVLIQEVRGLITELKTLRNEDAAPEEEKKGVYSLFVKILLG